MDWERVERLLDVVASMAPDERARHMDAAGLGAEERAEVERLLVEHDKSGAFLDAPAVPRPDTEELPTGWVPPAMSDVGRRIGPYRLMELTGEGGMGAVYLAERDDQYDHRVALKLIRYARGRDALVRFQQERQMLAALSHPNIARQRYAVRIWSPAGNDLRTYPVRFWLPSAGQHAVC